MSRTLEVITVVASVCLLAAVWFRLGWVTRERRILQQIRELEQLEALLKSEIARVRSVADQKEAAHYGTVIARRSDPKGWIH